MSKMYVCQCCGDRVGNVREWDIVGELIFACNECIDDSMRIQDIAENNAIQGDLNEICEHLYIDYFNNFGTVLRFAEHYRLSVSVASRVIKVGKAYNNR